MEIVNASDYYINNKIVNILLAQLTLLLTQVQIIYKL